MSYLCPLCGAITSDGPNTHAGLCARTSWRSLRMGEVGRAVEDIPAGSPLEINNRGEIRASRVAPVSCAGYFGCTCGGRVDWPHCHTGRDCPPETPSTSGRRHCVYGGIGCNVDHDAIARQSTDANAKADHLLRSVDFR